ncbi:thiamine biosynthesis protein [Desulfosarcina ovata subsp. sediminis]|uniref:Thiamine biosynthesis protein n=1 Tax=Desulfosarcina ovata subsp. sediminis TaxID=885957 RepID=A0A5K7ZRF1_9BACT|nr:ABC transporter substrate-binding protein [Desulfosarcina ovata]BBO81403.1 thiamine biosynthesis protein [Desulfosarcina ovata subsp. sediminis]
MKAAQNRPSNKWPGNFLYLFILLFFVPHMSFAKDVLRFGVLPVVDTLPLLVGQDAGTFSDQGIDLELVSFQSALERDAALQAGKLDGYFGDILNTLLLIQSGQPVKILTTAFHTHPDHRMFGIASAPGSGIESMQQLKGKDVAISRATIIEYVLDALLRSLALPGDYVTKQEIKKMPIRLQLLLSSQISAALLPEPLLTLAESKGAHVIKDDRRLDACLTVLAMDMTHISDKPDLCKRFLKAYGAAVAKINQNPEAFKEIMVERTRFPMPVKDLYRVPVFPEIAPPSERDIMTTQDWLMQHDLLKEKIPYGQVVF